MTGIYRTLIPDQTVGGTAGLIDEMVFDSGKHRVHSGHS